MIPPSWLLRQAARHRGAYEEDPDLRQQRRGDSLALKRPKPETTAQRQGKPRWNGKRHFLRLGAEPYRRIRQLIIDAKPPEPDKSRKG